MTIAETIRKKADGLQPKINNCFRERQTNTRKRAEEDARQRREGHTLKATQEIMRRVADLHEAGECPELIKHWCHTTEFQTAVSAVRGAERQKEEYGDRDGLCLARLSPERQLVRTMFQPPDPAAEKLHALLRDCVRGNIPGFFPTPAAVCERMVLLADIHNDHRVLEPSAGRGDICDALRKLVPEADLTVVEWQHSLREILCLKGFEIETENDFLKWAPVEGVLYDRILMNPPFENRQDIDHVRRAYTFLKPGGRLVAIMSPGTWFGSDKKAKAFQDDYGDCERQKLESGTFENTGVSATLVVIDNHEAEAV